MYGYFTKRPVRTKVKSVKIYALDNAIQPQALQITISINDFLRFKHYSITVLQYYSITVFEKQKYRMDFTFVLTGRGWGYTLCPQGGALGYGNHWAFSPSLLVYTSVDP